MYKYWAVGSKGKTVNIFLKIWNKYKRNKYL